MGGLSTKKLTHKKLSHIIDLKNSINILVDSKISDAEADQVCNNDFKYLLQDSAHIGTLIKIKGILVLYNKKLTQIMDVKIIKEGQLLEFEFKTNNVWVNVVACYVPPALIPLL